jgi:uncharacterized membrane protein
MGKGRLEAFSDGVLAIILTIMVLELKAPHGDSWRTLLPLLPTFLSYVLSYLSIAVYWNNHHHLFHAVKQVNGKILWANIHLLFWLSLVPFTTAWMGDNHFATLPVAAYGVVLFMAGTAYFLLTRSLVHHHGQNSLLRSAVGTDVKTKVSMVIVIVAIPLAFLNRWLAFGLYWLVIVPWLVPDRRIEKVMLQAEAEPSA